jgi:hypothetical protein
MGPLVGLLGRVSKGPAVISRVTVAGYLVADHPLAVGKDFS